MPVIRKTPKHRGVVEQLALPPSVSTMAFISLRLLRSVVGILCGISSPSSSSNQASMLFFLSIPEGSVDDGELLDKTEAYAQILFGGS
jgi:hypothetical protein